MLGPHFYSLAIQLDLKLLFVLQATKKERSLFNKPMRTPSNLSDLHHGGDGASNDDLNRLTSEYSGLNMFTLSPIGSPNSAADLEN